VAKKNEAVASAAESSATATLVASDVREVVFLDPASIEPDPQNPRGPIKKSDVWPWINTPIAESLRRFNGFANVSEFFETAVWLAGFLAIDGARSKRTPGRRSRTPSGG
jgi:hypothetical protein